MNKKNKKKPFKKNYQDQTWTNAGGTYVKKWVNRNCYKVYRIKET